MNTLEDVQANKTVLNTIVASYLRQASIDTRLQDLAYYPYFKQKAI